jgi:tripartite-type tricarboxylate transporter receptor subunit TctC
MHIIAKLNQEFVKAARTPELTQRLVANGNVIATTTPEEMAKIVADEVRKYGGADQGAGAGRQINNIAPTLRSR